LTPHLTLRYRIYLYDSYLLVYKPPLSIAYPRLRHLVFLLARNHCLYLPLAQCYQSSYLKPEHSTATHELVVTGVCEYRCPANNGGSGLLAQDSLFASELIYCVYTPDTPVCIYDGTGDLITPVDVGCAQTYSACGTSILINPNYGYVQEAFGPDGICIYKNEGADFDVCVYYASSSPYAGQFYGFSGSALCQISAQYSCGGRRKRENVVKSHNIQLDARRTRKDTSQPLPEFMTIRRQLYETKHARDVDTQKHKKRLP